ncbi:unnamed protein product [Polarella glacialis]|uniref:Pentatricopeptide repeat-containing protein, chloroplastic n=1 Tax=Polarella glacialis TaxID=89957 RepID=A0A813DGZ4_POLGL|nr:unnamed protein product [Polarella glacialis]
MKPYALGSVISFNVSMTALERGRHWQKALALLPEMLQLRLVPDGVSRNVAISACRRGSRWQAALHWLRAAWSPDLPPPDLVGFSAAITACTQAHQPDWALKLFQEIKVCRLAADEVCRGAVISACERSGQWQLAVSVLLTGQGQGSGSGSASLVSHNAAIAACGKAGQWQAAIALLSLARASRHLPDAVSFHSAAEACRRQAHWPAVLALLREMGASSRQPRTCRAEVLGLDAFISAQAWQPLHLQLISLRRRAIAVVGKLQEATGLLDGDDGKPHRLAETAERLRCHGQLPAAFQRGFKRVVVAPAIQEASALACRMNFCQAVTPQQHVATTTGSALTSATAGLAGLERDAMSTLGLAGGTKQSPSWHKISVAGIESRCARKSTLEHHAHEKALACPRAHTPASVPA